MGWALLFQRQSSRGSGCGQDQPEAGYKEQAEERLPSLPHWRQEKDQSGCGSNKTTFEKTPGVQREVMEHRVQSIYVHTGLWTMSLRSLHPKDSISVGETGRQQSEWCWGKEEKPGFHKCWSSHQPQTLGSCLLGGVLHTRRKVPLHCKQSPKKSDRT